MHGIQLDLVHGGGSVHHQVLCILVHGEGNNLADGFLAAQQHHDTVDARGCTGMDGHRPAVEWNNLMNDVVASMDRRRKQMTMEKVQKLISTMRK